MGQEAADSFKFINSRPRLQSNSIISIKPRLLQRFHQPSAADAFYIIATISAASPTSVLQHSCWLGSSVQVIRRVIGGHGSYANPGDRHHALSSPIPLAIRPNSCVLWSSPSDIVYWPSKVWVIQTPRPAVF